MTTSFAVFMAFCVIGFDFMLYVLYQLQYGEKRARRAAAVAAASRRAGLTELPSRGASWPATVAKARQPEIIPFLPADESAAGLYFAAGVGPRQQANAFSRTGNESAGARTKLRSAK